MDQRGRRPVPAQGNQYPPSTSYHTKNSSGGHTYPPQYASNYASAQPPEEHMQHHKGAFGAPLPQTANAQFGHGAPAPVSRTLQGTFGGGISPPLPTSASAYRGYTESSYGGSTAHGSQYAHVQPGTPLGFSPPFHPEQPPSSREQSPFSMMNTWSMFSSVSKMGQNVQASQEYVSSKVSWFTGGFFLQLFQVDSSYVLKKMVMLMLPYLHKYDYVRAVPNDYVRTAPISEPYRMEGNASVIAPPRSDLYAPDLYIPLLAMFTYVILAACNKFANGLFTPDVVHSMATWAVIAWGLNYAVLWTVMRMMALQNPPPGVELFAYSGYIFVNFCTSILFGWALGRGIGWHTAWLYTSTCMSVFLIRTFKHYILSNGPQPGIPGGHHTQHEVHGNSRRNAHLMLIMGGAQFVVSWLMGTTLNARDKFF